MGERRLSKASNAFRPFSARRSPSAHRGPEEAIFFLLLVTSSNSRGVEAYMLHTGPHSIWERGKRWAYRRCHGVTGAKYGRAGVPGDCRQLYSQLCRCAPRVVPCIILSVELRECNYSRYCLRIAHRAVQCRKIVSRFALFFSSIP